MNNVANESTPVRRAAVVTGGSAGLGLAIAQALLARGDHVTVLGRDADRLASAKASLITAGASADRVSTVLGDATQRPDADRLVAEHLQRFGQLDVLVNVVGQSDRGRVDQLDVGRARQLWEINVASTLVCSQAALPALRTRRGVIVNIGSLASRVAPRYLGGYVAAKHALAGMTRQMRLECAESGVHVGLVCPGPIARQSDTTEPSPRYQLDPESGVPMAAAAPGGGAKLSGLPPERVAAAVLRCIDRRQIEIILPWRVRLLMLIDALSPSLADRLLKNKTT